MDWTAFTMNQETVRSNTAFVDYILPAPLRPLPVEPPNAASEEPPSEG